MFFEPDLRNVNSLGVMFVMNNFFSGILADEFGDTAEQSVDKLDLICDEASLDTGMKP
jgi:hypothetical protein